MSASVKQAIKVVGVEIAFNRYFQRQVKFTVQNVGPRPVKVGALVGEEISNTGKVSPGFYPFEKGLTSLAPGQVLESYPAIIDNVAEIRFASFGRIPVRGSLQKRYLTIRGYRIPIALGWKLSHPEV